MNDLIIYEIVKTIFRFILYILGSLFIVIAFLLWITNGTILDFKTNKPKVYDTIYILKTK